MTVANRDAPACHITYQHYLQQALAYQQAGRIDQALEAYGRAIEADPQQDAAIRLYRRLLSQAPDGHEGLNDLAIALANWANLDLAIDCLKEAIALRPDFAQAYNNLGLMLKTAGQVEQAIGYYQKAIALSPDYANAHWNLALALLLLGRLDEGWPEFQWRARADLKAILPSQRAAQRTWYGQRFDGKTLLLRYEQGIGDCIQMVRYLPQVKARGGQVVLEAPRQMHPLLQGLEGLDRLVPARPDGIVHVPHDLEAFIMDLPGIFGTTLQTIPAQVPYIVPDQRLVRAWAIRLPSGRPRIGLVWAGSDRHSNDRSRSCDLGQFRTFLDLDDITFVSLQKGKARMQLQAGPDLRIVDLADQLEDWHQTAAVIANLDLVISVDTAVLHLAGAMGRPAWGLLPFVPDWRWLLGRTDSPWYPTLRLFRQDRPGDWATVTAAVRDELIRYRHGSRLEMEAGNACP